MDYKEINKQVAQTLGYTDFEECDSKLLGMPPEGARIHTLIQHYSKNLWAAFGAAKELELFKSCVLYRLGDGSNSWVIARLLTGHKIASGATVPLAICNAIVALVKENKQ